MPMAEEHEQDPETLRDMLRESMTKDKNINVFVAVDPWAETAS